MKPNPIKILVVILILGQGLWSQEKKHYLTPAEVIKIMNESKTVYRLADSLAKLEPGEEQDLAQSLFPVGCAPIDYPRLVQKDGRTFVQEFLFKNEAVGLMEKAETYFAKKDYEEARKNYELALQAGRGTGYFKKNFANGDIDLFIMYEVFTRLCPVGMLVQPAEVQEQVERYIQKYMVTAF